MTDSTPKTLDPWYPCPPGTIAELTNQRLVERRDRRRFLFQLAGIGGTTMGVAVLTAISLRLDGLQQPDSKLPGGIACVRVHEQLAAFVANQISDVKLRAQISRHLFQCVDCQKAFQALNQGNEFRCDDGAVDEV